MTTEFESEPGLVSEMISRAKTEGVDVSGSYQITTIIPYADEEPEVETYTLPVEDLDDFFHGYTKTAELVVDIRPVE